MNTEELDETLRLFSLDSSINSALIKAYSIVSALIQSPELLSDKNMEKVCLMYSLSAKFSKSNFMNDKFVAFWKLSINFLNAGKEILATECLNSFFYSIQSVIFEVLLTDDGCLEDNLISKLIMFYAQRLMLYFSSFSKSINRLRGQVLSLLMCSLGKYRPTPCLSESQEELFDSNVLKVAEFVYIENMHDNRALLYTHADFTLFRSYTLFGLIAYCEVAVARAIKNSEQEALPSLIALYLVALSEYFWCFAATSSSPPQASFWLEKLEKIVKTMVFSIGSLACQNSSKRVLQELSEILRFLSSSPDLAIELVVQNRLISRSVVLNPNFPHPSHRLIGQAACDIYSALFPSKLNPYNCRIRIKPSSVVSQHHPVVALSLLVHSNICCYLNDYGGFDANSTVESIFQRIVQICQLDSLILKDLVSYWVNSLRGTVS